MTTRNSQPIEATNASLPICIRELSYGFGKTQALNGVSLEVASGTVLGLVGVNGAGKTTLLKHLLGLYRPHNGTVRIFGQDPIADRETVLKRIGFLSEEESLPLWLTIADIMGFCRSVYSTWDERYANDLCNMFELSKTAKLSSLSKGTRARAGLMVAIGHRPEVLILDEPSSGLDPIARNQILESIVRAISEDGRTVIFSSHLLDEVQRLSDSIAILHQGQIIERFSLEKLDSCFVEIIAESLTHPRRLAELRGIPEVVSVREFDFEVSIILEFDQRSTTSSQSAQTFCATNQLSLINHKPVNLETFFEARISKSQSAVGQTKVVA